ncbi:MAG: PASTA domain-containing protein [Treponema sp.]|jgi:beta-lactam-binding protein with PASTA domain|nr:PASTA domain-containing protein [Treponema sp.]
MALGNLNNLNNEGNAAGNLKVFISMAISLIVFVGIIAVSVFFIAVQGADETMVPELRGKELTEALMELQVKELYPRIQLRYSQTSLDKGLILEQEPLAGTIVKAGRRIRLVVSQGVVINKVENYLGRNIDEVHIEIQTLAASQGNLAAGSSGRPLLSVKEPFMYEYSEQSAGTILQQKPEPDAEISGPTVLEFVVSRGPESATIKAPNLVGLSINDALELIGRTGIDFSFTLRPASGDEVPGTVVYQEPAGNSSTPANTRFSFLVNEPETVSEGEVFGLFTYNMPRNPYPLAIRIEAQFPSGERRRLLTVEYGGGNLSVPYQLPSGTTLILSMLNREIHRETVQ